MKKDIQGSLLFEGIDPNYISEFLQTLPKPLHLKAGEYLWRQGDSGEGMYLLNTGKLEVLLRSDNGQEMPVATVEKGAVIGEVCLLGEKFRTASIRVVEAAELLVIDRQNFQEKIKEKDPAVLTMCYNLARFLTHRLMAADIFISNLQKISNKEVKSEIETYRKRFYEDSLFD
jgi:CRP/FNR family cyclic AMP-dependent transcriptional regulator